jgi:hypothetical protein
MLQNVTYLQQNMSVLEVQVRYEIATPGLFSASTAHRICDILVSRLMQEYQVMTADALVKLQCQLRPIEEFVDDANPPCPTTAARSMTRARRSDVESLWPVVHKRMYEAAGLPFSLAAVQDAARPSHVSEKLAPYWDQLTPRERSLVDYVELTAPLPVARSGASEAIIEVQHSIDRLGSPGRSGIVGCLVPNSKPWLRVRRRVMSKTEMARLQVLGVEVQQR